MAGFTKDIPSLLYYVQNGLPDDEKNKKNLFDELKKLRDDMFEKNKSPEDVFTTMQNKVKDYESKLYNNGNKSGGKSRRYKKKPKRTAKKSRRQRKQTRKRTRKH